MGCGLCCISSSFNPAVEKQVGRVHLHERLHPGTGGLAPAEYLHCGRRLHRHLTAAGLVPLPFLVFFSLAGFACSFDMVTCGKMVVAKGAPRSRVSRLPTHQKNWQEKVKTSVSQRNQVFFQHAQSSQGEAGGPRAATGMAGHTCCLENASLRKHLALISP